MTTTPSTSAPDRAAGGGLDRRPVRLATAGLAGVLVLVLLFMVAALVISARSTTEAGTSLRVSDSYQAAERALMDQRRAENELLLDPGADQRWEQRRAAEEVVATLETVVVEQPELRRQVETLLSRHEDYVRAASVTLQETTETQVSRDTPRVAQREPAFESLQQLVTAESEEHRGKAHAVVSGLQRTQVALLAAVVAVFGLGLALIAVFGAALRGHRRQIAWQSGQNHRQSLHDTLTGLPNRTMLRTRGEPVVVAALQSGTDGAALLLIDLDRFREINDTLGHSYGDVVLQVVARRLQESLLSSDLVARLGGDEFAVLLPSVKDAEAAAQTAQKLLRVIEVSVEADGVCLDVEASIGIAIVGPHGKDVDTLVQHAEIAMYVAKGRAQGVCLYDEALNDHSPERLALIGELRGALHRGELVLHYQPRVGLLSQDGCAVEALVRWQHPVRGLLPPDSFIPLAERTGLIRPLTRYVLSAALQQCRSWQDAGRTLQVAVNISARNLHDEQFLLDVTELLAVWDVPVSCLELEVTESAIMLEPVSARTMLTRLSDLGITLSIDDFGAGYTSLAHLKDLPVHTLKIDRSFVSQMARDRSDALIVRSVVELGHNLGLTTTAEGVEDQETSDELTGLGCDFAQGYLFARPLPAKDLLAWYDDIAASVRAASAVTAYQAEMSE